MRCRLSDEDATGWLVGYLRHVDGERLVCRFKGVGKKTIACVLMFCLEREEFPVDTHVWRISRALGWVPAKASRDDAYSHLNDRVPPDVRCQAPSMPSILAHGGLPT